jgi:hypothetical protein
MGPPFGWVRRSREGGSKGPQADGVGVGLIDDLPGGAARAIGALLSVGGSYPWWSLAIFFRAST